MTASSFDLAVCNAMAGSGRPASKGAAIVRDTLAAFPDAVFVGVVEASNLLETTPHDWTPKDDERQLRKIQRSPMADAGVAAIIDRDRFEPTKIRWRVGVQPYINGRRIGMRMRPILIVVGRVDGRRRTRKFKVPHLPPKRYWALWPAMVARIRPTGAVLGDFNKLARAVGPALGRRTSMDLLIGILTPWSWRVTNKHVVDVGSDHNAVGITVHHPRKRKEHR